MGIALALPGIRQQGRLLKLDTPLGVDVHLSRGGIARSGTLDGVGRGALTDVPAGSGQVRFGSMSGKYARKDLRPTLNHNPKPRQHNIDALLDKYGRSTNPREI